MTLVKPPLATVEPGRPDHRPGLERDRRRRSARSTTPCWRSAAGGRRLASRPTASPSPTRQVVAEPVDRRPASRSTACRSSAPRDTYLVTGVSRRRVAAVRQRAGLRRRRRSTSPSPQRPPVTVNLVLAGKVVPDLFGQPLQGALSALSTAGDRRRPHRRRARPGDLEDARSRPTSQNSPVLVQLPAARQRRRPGHDPDAPRRRRRAARGADRHRPSLVGLTQAEARPALREDRPAAREDHRPELNAAHRRTHPGEPCPTSLHREPRHQPRRRSAPAPQLRGAAARAAAPRPVFVDVGADADAAQTSRAAGFAARRVAVNPGSARVVPRRPARSSRRRSSARAVPPGTAVARGTAIDIVLANPSLHPGGVIPGVHSALPGPDDGAAEHAVRGQHGRARHRPRTRRAPTTSRPPSARRSRPRSRRGHPDRRRRQNTVDSAFTGHPGRVHVVG